MDKIPNVIVKVGNIYESGGENGNIYSVDGIAPTIKSGETSTKGNGGIGSNNAPKIAVNPMRWVRSEKGKQARKENRLNGKDTTPFSDGHRNLIPSDDMAVGCITNAVNKDCLVTITEQRRQSKEIKEYTDVAPTVCSKYGTGGGNIPYVNNIRRLTEIECERLQGFPDNWTEYGNYDGEVKKVSKTQRYKMLGNAVTVDIVEMIFNRLNENHDNRRT